MFDPKPHLIQLPRRVKDRATGHYTTVFDLYLEVKWRLVWFREKFPRGVIETTEVLVDLDRGYARFRAVVCDGEGGQATGTGTETAAGFTDYVERAETRALGRALAALGIGTQFVGQDLTEGEHVADAPVATVNGQAVTPVTSANSEVEPEARISQDQARELKKVAQTVFGYVEGERRLRADLGFEVDEKLTLRHLAAHVTATQYATVMTTYDGLLRQQVDADVPEYPPPSIVPAEPPSPAVLLDGEPESPPEGDDRRRWGALSRRALSAGVLPSVWDSLRQAGNYPVAETMIAALETSSNGAIEGRGIDG